MDNDEIDLAELFKSIWFYKLSLLVFIVLSVPISVMYSTRIEPKYRAVTVFEKPSNIQAQSNASSFSNIGGLGLLGFLGGTPNLGSSDSFFSEIRSESLLKTVILNNREFDDQMLQKYCPLPSKETSRFSLRSLLIALGISENKAPNESQKISLLVQCVNAMLEIDFDTYGSDKSSAYRLSITSTDPFFSANLANQIVKKYFVRHEKSRDEAFQNVKKYLAKVIAESQLEFTEANKLMQNFVIRHSLLMNVETSFLAENAGVSLTLPPSPFADKLKKDVFSLSQLEKSLSKLKRARLNLSKLNEFEQDKIYDSILSSEIQEALSRTFVASISQIEDLSVGTDFKNQKINKLVSEEIQSLERQIQALEGKVNFREKKTMQLMTIENKFQELALDVSKKKLIFEGLKDQLKEKILATGLAGVEQPILLTKAVPPFMRVSPNRKLIVVLGLVLSVFAGIAYILIRQSFLRRVHSLSQLQKISRCLPCYGIKYRQLNKRSIRSDETVIGQSFFSRTMGRGKFGCVIDISQKRQNNFLASEFSNIIVSLLETDNLKIICLDASPSKKPFSASAQINFASDRSDIDVQGILNKGTLTLNDEDGLIAAGEVKKIKNKYADCDKVICALGAEVGDLTKFKFIEQCDFYILIGRSFHFDEYTYKKFSNAVWEKEQKCVGFFLID